MSTTLHQNKSNAVSCKQKRFIQLRLQDTLVPQLIERVVDGSDLDVRVISAYMNQCTGEAQEGRP